MKETSIEELFEEYHQERLNDEHDYPWTRDPEEIIKEITTKIEENVLREVVKQPIYEVNDDVKTADNNWVSMENKVITVDDIKSLAESKNIKL